MSKKQEADEAITVFDALDRTGRIVEASGQERHRMLIADFLTAQVEDHRALIIAPTGAEVEKLKRELRSALKERGALDDAEPLTACVCTAHASQGKAAHKVFISIGRKSLHAVNPQQWYVSTSRCGGEMDRVNVYVDSKQDVRRAVARTE
jgi:hypothetical protein